MRIFAPSKQVSAKNQAAHTKMKFRWGAGLVLLLCTVFVSSAQASMQYGGDVYALIVGLYHVSAGRKGRLLPMN